MGAFAAWQKRRAAWKTLRSGDPWVCPYCRSIHPQFEVGGTRFGFGYPSVKLGCCGKVAFMLKDPKSGALMSFTRIGDGKADWLPKEAYFAWHQEQKEPRGYREGLHADLQRPEPGSRAKPAHQAETVQLAPPAPAPASNTVVPKPVAWVAVGKVQDLKPDQAKVVEVNGQRIALYNVAGQLFATQDTCKHAGRSLGQSVLEDGMVTCNGHGWRYDVRTGIAEHNPDIALQRYPVKVEGDTVLLAA
ncbi:MAG: non-heme iron oxygenase ferredoxin subunit [Halobacteriales archaeon]|nr:non-heme iron oxygenase ferredoxin subunit [Halobacteriales archaeon]